MNDADDLLIERAAKAPTVATETGTWLGDGRVLVGATAVALPVVADTAPQVGESVQVAWLGGRGLVIGPAQPRPAVWTVVSVSSGVATLATGGQTISAPHTGAAPATGAQALVVWTERGPVCAGALSTTLPVPTPIPPPMPPPETFDVNVRATDSGRYRTDWWGAEPWAGAGNSGMWAYGTRIRDALQGATALTALEAFFPLDAAGGPVQVGLAAGADIPAGPPSITNLTTLPGGGWQLLPTGWLPVLAAGGYGLGVVSDAPTPTTWASVRSDPASGQLRLQGTR